MLEPRPEVLDFLQTRRSRPWKILSAPYPTHADLKPIIELGLRVPDHGTLEPWRLIVIEGAALQRLADLTVEIGKNLDHIDDERLEKTRRQFAEAGMIVTVVVSPVESPKVPEIEQTLSGGAVCLSLVNAGLASGWGSNWLTGWMAMNRDFLSQGLNLAENEFVAGFIHFGTENTTPPERKRPDAARITTWINE